MEWKEVLAKDFCFEVTDGTHDSPKPKEDGHFLITSKHLLEFSLDYSKAYKISEEDYQKIIVRSRVDQYDILFSMIGTIGNLHRVTANVVDFAVKNVGIFKFGGDKYKSLWLYYWFKSPKAKEYINSTLAGSTQSYLTLNSLRLFPILVPEQNDLVKIADILSSLDAKIENNNKINEKLEEMAQALFKSWFIDFEPFKDGEFVDSELGRIPKGWKVGCYNDIIETTVSGDWGKDTFEGNYTHKVACIRGCDFQDIRNGVRGATPERYILEKNYQAKHLVDKDIIVEISGGTSTISTGRICLISEELLNKYKHDIVCTNFCRVARPIEGFSSYVYYSWLWKYNGKVMFGYENGTSGIKNFRMSDFLDKEPLVIPLQKEIEQFQKIIDILYKRIQENGSENTKLALARDTLLPKLMSGEIEL